MVRRLRNRDNTIEIVAFARIEIERHEIRVVRMPQCATTRDSFRCSRG
jgi:hypothetical protein